MENCGDRGAAVTHEVQVEPWARSVMERRGVDVACGVCKGRFRVPKALPCMHSFCQACLADLIAKDKAALARGGILCPLCRRLAVPPTPSSCKRQWAASFPTNLYLAALLDLAEEPCHGCYERSAAVVGTLWCHDCAVAFCDDCAEFHRKLPCLADHHLQFVGKVSKETREADRTRVKVKGKGGKVKDEEPRNKTTCTNAPGSLCGVAGAEGEETGQLEATQESQGRVHRGRHKTPPDRRSAPPSDSATTALTTALTTAVTTTSSRPQGDGGGRGEVPRRPGSIPTVECFSCRQQCRSQQATVRCQQCSEAFCETCSLRHLNMFHFNARSFCFQQLPYPEGVEDSASPQTQAQLSGEGTALTASDAQCTLSETSLQAEFPEDPPPGPPAPSSSHSSTPSTLSPSPSPSPSLSRLEPRARSAPPCQAAPSPQFSPPYPPRQCSLLSDQSSRNLVSRRSACRALLAGAMEQSGFSLTCSVCRQRFKTPRALPCLHSFCQQCLADLISCDRFAQARGGIPCPQCGRLASPEDPSLPVSQWALAFPANPYLQTLLRAASPELCFCCQEEAIRLCVQCQETFCDNCANYHVRMPAMREHEILILPGMKTRQPPPPISVAVPHDSLSSWTEEEVLDRPMETKFDDDLEKPLITDLAALSMGRVVAADFNNRCIKMWKAGKRGGSFKLTLEGSPFGVCAIDDVSVAVTIPEFQRVIILAAKVQHARLTRKNSFMAQRKAYGITAISKDRLAVTCPWEKVVDLVGVTGRVFSSLKGRGQENQLFWPEYVAYTSQDRIVLTDSRLQTMTCWTLDGSRNWTLERGRLREPLGVTSDGLGGVYVADGDSRSVWHLPSGVESLRSVLTPEGHGMGKPRALAWRNDRLYVDDQGLIKVFPV